MSNPWADLSALRRQLQALPRDELLVIAQRAIELLPDAALPTLLGDVVQIEHGLQATAQTPSLLEEARGFSATSMSGKFYDGFDVNSRNCTQQSRGTDAFIAEFDRLPGRCVREADTIAGGMSANPSNSSSDCFGTSQRVDRRSDSEARLPLMMLDIMVAS